MSVPKAPALALLLAACAPVTAASSDGEAGAGSNADADADAGAIADADASMAADADTAAPFIPAPHPALPQVGNHGGPVLTQPLLTAITYDGYDLRGPAEDVVATIGASTFWQATTAEYGISAAVAGNAVHLAGPPPASIDDAGIRSWLAQSLDGTHLELGTPAAGSLYVLFYPAATTVTNATLAGCAAFSGYHASVLVPSGPAAGTNVPYVVIPECDGPGGAQFVMETAASHELVEAATDPFGTTAVPGPAWSDVDDDHLVWQQLLGGGEVTDLCQLLPDAKFNPPGYPHGVERSWSNDAAGAGHDPCAPALASEIYFAAAAVLPDAVTIMDGSAARATRGVLIPLGASRTVEVDLWSDGPAAPWTVSATDMSPAVGGAAGSLAFSWDATTGANGAKLHLTITALARTPIGGQPFMITSSNGADHPWFGYVAPN